jgi:Domain of unknown function (DUF6602)
VRYRGDVSTSQDRVRDYFRIKARQLLALAELPTGDHSGLSGSHREEIQRIYLSEILPKRFTVGRGLIYGPLRRSREADIVIWDALNYPGLPMADHSFYFAESVKAVVESKSRWSQKDFEDVLLKSQHIRNIITSPGPSIEDTLTMMQFDIESLRTGTSHVGMVRTRHHIATAGVFLSGGETAFQGSKELAAEILECADDSWPDLLLLLGPGCLVIKEYYPNESRGKLLFFEFGEDALLAFTNALLKLISDRSVLAENIFYMEHYADEVLYRSPYRALAFPLTRPLPGRIPIWAEWDE